MKRVALYRHYDKDEVLLYIGISLYVFNRLKQHQDGSCWAEKAVVMKTEWFGSRCEALNAEKKAIHNEAPKHNVVHNLDNHDAVLLAPRKDSFKFKSNALEFAIYKAGGKSRLARLLVVTPQAINGWRTGDIPNNRIREVAEKLNISPTFLNNLKFNGNLNKESR